MTVIAAAGAFSRKVRPPFAGQLWRDYLCLFAAVGGASLARVLTSKQQSRWVAGRQGPGHILKLTAQKQRIVAKLQRSSLGTTAAAQQRLGWRARQHL
jgi:hypothetical protein